MISVRIIWVLICLLWIAAEIKLTRSTRLENKQIADGEWRSQTWLWFSVIGSLILALMFKNLAWTPIPIEYLRRQCLAIVLCASGLGLRYWAVVNLGSFFSTHVLIQNQHQLITIGPYRWIRHPAYTGLLISLAGAGLAMGDFLGLLLLTVWPFFAFNSRISIEEKMLIDKFGEQYSGYLKSTYKLLPPFY